MTDLAERKSLLQRTSHAFCSALLSPPSPSELLDKHFTKSNPKITEHGPEWARSRLPFIAKTFEGKDGCESYFTVLSQTLKMEMDPFPDAEQFAVCEYGTVEQGDGGSGVVFVVGGGTFTSVKTGKSWKEKFVYRLSGFDVEGRIGHWEIWADPLSAWEAVKT
jgi:hypothetical protein